MIKTKYDLIKFVEDEYMKYDTELSREFFDVEVEMTKGDILEAFVECQRNLNGDYCVRVENGKEYDYDDIVPEDFNVMHKGNAKDFLVSLNNDPRFLRYCADDETTPDFVW